MSLEIPAMEELALGFGARWYETDDPAERERCAEVSY